MQGKQYQDCGCKGFWRLTSILSYLFSYFDNDFNCRECAQTRVVTKPKGALHYVFLFVCLVVAISFFVHFMRMETAEPDKNGDWMTRSDAVRETFENFPLFEYIFVGIVSSLLTFLICLPVLRLCYYLLWRKSGSK